MEENKKQTVEMTAEEAEAFKQFQEKQAKEKAAKKRKEDREAYAQLVDSEIESAIPELRSLSEQMLAVKRKVYENFAEVINIKANVLKLTKDTQRTHTFTHSNGKMRLTLGYNYIDDYRDTVNDGIAIVKQYIESLATDTKSKELVATILQLLSRDGTGNLKASRVLQLRKLADKSDNDQFKEGVQIIEEAYQPSLTKQFIRAEWKDEHNKWHIIPLSVTDVETTETKQEANEDNDNQGTQSGTV
jgi:hypothetical protein